LLQPDRNGFGGSEFDLTIGCHY